jgi:hypothetical protein
MPKIRLQVARVVAGIGEDEAAGVVQQVSLERQPD